MRPKTQARHLNSAALCPLCNTRCGARRLLHADEKVDAHAVSSTRSLVARGELDGAKRRPEVHHWPGQTTWAGLEDTCEAVRVPQGRLQAPLWA